MEYILWGCLAGLALAVLTIGIANRFETPEDPED